MTTADTHRPTPWQRASAALREFAQAKEEADKQRSAIKDAAERVRRAQSDQEKAETALQRAEERVGSTAGRLGGPEAAERELTTFLLNHFGPNARP